MNAFKKLTRRAAQRVVDAAMGNGLSQQSNTASDNNSSTARTTYLCRETATEGCVLLSNDATLPLNTNNEVAVFGRCARDWFYMGRGSGGDVNPPYNVNLMDGLDDAEACYNRVLSEMYRAWCESSSHEADPGWWGHWPAHHEEMPITPELARATAHTAHTAIVVIGRCAGEDLDLPLAPGGYYLAKDELELLNAVTEAFDRTVVVLNVGNAIDLSWIESYGTKIGAVLLSWQGGMESGHAVADVLYGNVNPSGRLACTFARSYEAYPSSKSFGSKTAVDYNEGIYVGYRYFATNAPKDVLFGFGHGLSYTTFRSEITLVEQQENRIVVRVRTTNTGKRVGKTAVLLWCDLPSGTLDKPTRVLAAFDKTDELARGATQTIDLSCDLATIASFDNNAHAFVLEPGDYWFSLDNTQHAKTDEVTPDHGIHIGDRRLVQQCEPLCSSSDELRTRILSRLPQELDASNDETRATFGDVASGKTTLDTFVAQLSNNELEALCRGDGNLNSALGTPGNAGAFGGVTPELRELGVPVAICADGPSGARLQQRCSLLPCATALASTWNTPLVQQLYAAVGNEVRRSGVNVLLAPALNIQRDPRCGRNFEYFSEDPLVSGHMAIAAVRGLQSEGVSACPKHFACNNQETHRNTSDSLVSEQALREIYLRGFELCVRNASPDLIMTSYNKVNGVWAHYNYDLATTVLREEWEFEGVVITDWWMRPARSPEFPKLRNNAYRLRAGVDVLMPGSMSHVLKVYAKATGITRAELQRSARRVLAYLLKHIN